MILRVCRGDRPSSMAVLAAGVHVPIVGSSDAAAKKEDRKEDGAPPKAEEQA